MKYGEEKTRQAARFAEARKGETVVGQCIIKWKPTQCTGSLTCEADEAMDLGRAHQAQ